MRSAQGLLFPDGVGEPGFADELREFAEFGTPTRVTFTPSSCGRAEVPTYVNEFWTSRQRQASSLHEISYRACFKPQLPRFFIERLTAPGDRVYDPFMGRGTTLLEAALRGRVPLGCDINPLSAMLLRPRLRPPQLDAVAERLREMDWTAASELPEELLVFYHEDTLRELVALRDELLQRARDGRLDALDDWIRAVAVNRLTGHSKGFFSVYTLPPNQAVSVDSQRKINERRQQAPDYRDVAALILRKTRSLLRDVDDAARSALAGVADRAALFVDDCRTAALEPASVKLVVTSPPFLDVVQYHSDNWLRCWFCGVDATAVKAAMHRKLDDWREAMTEAFAAFRRALVPGGHVAFEVGEVRRGSVRLEEAVLTAGVDAGLAPELVLINDQQFTKTANCWGVHNNRVGTNTNRIALFRNR